MVWKKIGIMIVAIALAVLFFFIVKSTLFPPEKLIDLGPVADMLEQAKQSEPERQGATAEHLHVVLEMVKTEPKVRDAAWAPLSTPTSPILWVAMDADGSDRSGYAEYLCEVLTDQQINCASVTIKDFAKMVRDEWETIGMAECGCE